MLKARNPILAGNVRRTLVPSGVSVSLEAIGTMSISPDSNMDNSVSTRSTCPAPSACKLKGT